MTSPPSKGGRGGSRHSSHSDFSGDDNSDSGRRASGSSCGASPSASPSLRRSNSSGTEKKLAGRFDAFLFLCNCISILTVFSASLCMILNSISVYRSFNRTGQHVFVGILRCYAVPIAGFVAIAESEWQGIFRLWGILEYWVGRGMLQIFVAVMTKALAEASGETKFETYLHVIASSVLLGCGAIYTIFGLLCFRRLKTWRMKQVHQRENALKDLEEVERRRRELHGLLDMELDP